MGVTSLSIGHDVPGSQNRISLIVGTTGLRTLPVVAVLSETRGKGMPASDLFALAQAVAHCPLPVAASVAEALRQRARHGWG